MKLNEDDVNLINFSQKNATDLRTLPVSPDKYTYFKHSMCIMINTFASDFVHIQFFTHRTGTEISTLGVVTGVTAGNAA